MIEKNLHIPDFEEKTVVLDGHNYEILVRGEETEGFGAPRLAIVSYLPNKQAIDLLKLAILTIKKFTTIPYELWVVDNNSSIEHLDWLIEQKNVNVILNRTDPKEANGSYANAVGLELVAAVIPQDTHFFMAMHQDVVPCHTEWLTYLLSKFETPDIKAVGVREDKFRIKEGILHVLGYVIDFQFFRENKLNFYPDLPDYDVGDKAIHGIRNLGFEYYACANTHTNAEVEKDILGEIPFKDLQVDRTLNDKGEVIYMHLGRGVLKSENEFADKAKSLSVWNEFINKHLLTLDPGMNEKLHTMNVGVMEDPWYSFRRYYVDSFFTRSVNLFHGKNHIIDIGGVKNNKRGNFSIEGLPFQVTYANIDQASNPDLMCDAGNIPVPDCTFDGAILGEVLEHLGDPKSALKEAYRILKPGGRLLISTPFMYQIHAHPYDFYRFTDYWYESVLPEIGFRKVDVTSHGAFPTLLAGIIKAWTYELLNNLEYKNKHWVRLLSRFSRWFNKKAMEMELEPIYKSNLKLKGHTSGFGVVCIK